MQQQMSENLQQLLIEVTGVESVQAPKFAPGTNRSGSEMHISTGAISVASPAAARPSALGTETNPTRRVDVGEASGIMFMGKICKAEVEKKAEDSEEQGMAVPGPAPQDAASILMRAS